MKTFPGIIYGGKSSTKTFQVLQQTQIFLSLIMPLLLTNYCDVHWPFGIFISPLFTDLKLLINYYEYEVV